MSNEDRAEMILDMVLHYGSGGAFNSDAQKANVKAMKALRGEP